MSDLTPERLTELREWADAIIESANGYRPWDQSEKLGDATPWPADLIDSWEAAHGHDCRLKCYAEYGCQLLEVEGAENTLALLDALDSAREEAARLQCWKDEALPILTGLQEVGQALGLGLGCRITGRDAVDAALDLHNERDKAHAQVAALTERLDAVKALAEGRPLTVDAHLQSTNGGLFVEATALRAVLGGDDQ